jgi:hypothetical protein
MLSKTVLLSITCGMGPTWNATRDQGRRVLDLLATVLLVPGRWFSLGITLY